MGILDSVGKVRLPVEYDLLQLCEESVYALKNKTLYVYTNQLQQVFEQTYQDLLPLQEFCYENYLTLGHKNTKNVFISLHYFHFFTLHIFKNTLLKYPYIAFFVF
jgi:hypothetical protein